LIFVSTRGQAPVLSFEEVVLTGLAKDGGLYLPQEWPVFSKADFRHFSSMNYTDLAIRIMFPFVQSTISEDDFADIVSLSYKNFSHPAVAPLRQLNRNDWVLELFHGPTLAFKDYALQFLGYLFDFLLKKRGKKIVIVGATSGDTGSAAIEACRDRDSIDIVILHPHERTSLVQRKQMTTVMAKNVHNIAIEGTFDDCQDLVKGMFNDSLFRQDMNLSAVNSINWARIMAQIVYYISAGTALGSPDRAINFSVPTGNFGNVYAAIGAKKMGLSIDQIIVASNNNDILPRFLDEGAMISKPVIPTISPSMDIQISSNFERYLFDIFEGDSKLLCQKLEDFRQKGHFELDNQKMTIIRNFLSGYRLDDSKTEAVMADILHKTGFLADPHTAIGIAAGQNCHINSNPTIALATAHAAKFPEAVERATGIKPMLPDSLSDLYSRKETFSLLPNNLNQVQAHIRKVIGH
jgi:threonine synthase